MDSGMWVDLIYQIRSNPLLSFFPIHQHIAVNWQKLKSCAAASNESLGIFFRQWCPDACCQVAPIKIVLTSRLYALCAQSSSLNGISMYVCFACTYNHYITIYFIYAYTMPIYLYIMIHTDVFRLLLVCNKPVCRPFSSAGFPLFIASPLWLRRMRWANVAAGWHC